MVLSVFTWRWVVIYYVPGSKQATRPVCLPVAGTGHGFEAWPVAGRPGQESRKARQAAQNRQAMACLQCFLSVNRNVIFDQET